MCGIVGFTWEDPAALRRMTEAVRHRGPNAEGSYTAPGISLGHRRLSIIDLSAAANQPMQSADGRYTIVYNGEIYNFQSIRQTLETRGVRFRTQSDTEVLLEALAAWGTEALHKLNGMFAFALWDTHTHTLLLARDPIGIKPLYWTQLGTEILFASEAKALLTHPEVPRTLNLPALSTFLRFQYVPSPDTLWAHIHKVPPGTFVTVRNGSATTQRYWQPTSLPPFHDAGTAQEAIAAAVKEAVNDQLVSDVTLGVFLSGGVDSTAVLGAMRACRGSGTIKTFSIGFEAQLEKDKYNADALAAQETARFYGTDHQLITMNGCDVAAAFDRIVWHMDEPIGNPIQAATLFLAQHARPEITVALGGDGGDELFGGYDRYWIAAQLERFEHLPPALQAALRRMFMLTGQWPAVADKLAHRTGLARYQAFMAQKEDRLARILLPAAGYHTTAPQAFAAHLSGTPDDIPGAMMRTDLATWLPDESLLRTDKMTMAFALEQRVPLLDMRVVDAAMRTPTAWKLGSRTQGKRILRRALAAYLPPHIRHQKKRGFFSPTAKWLRGELLPLAREVLSPSYTTATADLIDFTEVERLLADHVAAKQYGLPVLWSLMSLQGWARRFQVSR